MRRITGIAAALILLVGATLGCGLQRYSEPTETTAEPKRPATQQAEVVLVNSSSQTICYVYIVPFMADGGDDWLGPDEMLSPGASRTFEIAPGRYDMYANDCTQTDGAFYQGNPIDSRSYIEVVGTYTWEVTD
jgi:hypothetical protein